MASTGCRAPSAVAPAAYAMPPGWYLGRTEPPTYCPTGIQLPVQGSEQERRAAYVVLGDNRTRLFIPATDFDRAMACQKQALALREASLSHGQKAARFGRKSARLAKDSAIFLVVAAAVTPGASGMSRSDRKEKAGFEREMAAAWASAGQVELDAKVERMGQTIHVRRRCSDRGVIKELQGLLMQVELKNYAGKAWLTSSKHIQLTMPAPRAPNQKDPHRITIRPWNIQTGSFAADYASDGDDTFARLSYLILTEQRPQWQDLPD